jgi:hypothetical protein
MSDNPFSVLGLPARAGLTDDDVRAAWRRQAAATHPDRADGGDPARFAAAAAAYTMLRTRSGRGEALADLTAPAPPPRPARPADPGRPAAVPRPARIRRGWRARLVLRVAIVAAVSVAAVAVAGFQPGTPAVIVGAVTWLLLTGRLLPRNGG